MNYYSTPRVLWTPRKGNTGSYTELPYRSSGDMPLANAATAAFPAFLAVSFFAEADCLFANDPWARLPTTERGRLNVDAPSFSPLAVPALPADENSRCDMQALIDAQNATIAIIILFMIRDNKEIHDW